MRRRPAAVLVAVLLVAGCTAPVRHGSVYRPAKPLPTQSAPPAGRLLDGTSEPVPDPLYPNHGNPAVDVLRYDLRLDWQPDRRLLSGTAKLTIRVVRPVTEVRLDLSDALAVSRATLDDAAVTATRSGHRVTLVAGRELAPDSTLTATVDYAGTPKQVPFPGIRKDVNASGAEIAADGTIWSMQEPYGGFTWYPCSDHPSDKALYNVAITAPSGWSGVTSGRFLGAEATAGGNVNRWQATEPVASYLVAFAIGRYQRVDLTGPHGLPITLWLTDAQESTVLPLLRRTPELLTWLEQRFGRYPFSSAGVVVVPDRSALETQTMVTMGPLASESILLHELAHQWFGDAVGPRTWRDLWLNEGFATYAELLYRADRFGTDPRVLLRQFWEREKASRATAGPAGNPDPRYFAEQNVYYGPALMLHEIRGQLGDDAFFAMLHDWAQHHRHTTQDRASFTAWLTRYTGRDLSPIIDKWLDSPTTPDLPA